MKRKLLSLISMCVLLFSCVEPAEVKKSSSKKKNKDVEVESVDSSGVAAKNFAQINNTYSTLTGVGMKKTVDEYNSVQSQLPSSSNPSSLNGFNQIASTRLAFSYCEEMIGDESPYLGMETDEALEKMVNQFIDISLSDEDHKNMFKQLQAIMNNEDKLLADNTDDKKKKLLHLSCTAILSSNYVTLI